MKSRTDGRARARNRGARGRAGEAGFSLIELMVALGVTLVIMVVASRMLAMSMAVRTRENQRSEAVADAQRALQTMTREISNAGLGMTNNGLVDANSGETSIRVRTNLDALCSASTTCDLDTTEPGEDVVFAIVDNTTGGVTQRLITRQDIYNSNAVSPLANRVDTLRFQYFKSDGTETTTASQAQRVRITITVTLPAVGSLGRDGYQPASQMQLVSEAVLRNLLFDQ